MRRVCPASRLKAAGAAWPRLLAVLAANVCLAGCESNSTIAISSHQPKALIGRAVLVFSVAVEAPWPYQDFAVQLDRYDLKRQDTAGGCGVFERVSGDITPPIVGARKYFAFLVPPGAYAYSRFNGASLDGPSQASLVPASQVTYVGDFTYVGTRSGSTARKGEVINIQERMVRLSFNLAAAEKAVDAKLNPAKAVKVVLAHPFLCTP